MTPRAFRRIESADNPHFKRLKQALSGRGIRKHGVVIVSGRRSIRDVLAAFPEACEAWIATEDHVDPPAELAPGTPCLQLARGLFRTLDTFGTDAPLILMRTPSIPDWDVAAGLPEGCSLLIPFQDPENVGAAVRSAVAFQVDSVILLAEAGHPFHPKAVRASGGAVFHARLLAGPPLGDLPADLPLVPLSAEGRDIATFEFPERFGLLPGLEGRGIPTGFRARALSIPIAHQIESLNAAAATAIALYVWSCSRRRQRLELP
jgi:tRNA G18 (ribose-2'-O)-methylase SpoU